jgi:hypothetical protein
MMEAGQVVHEKQVVHGVANVLLCRWCMKSAWYTATSSPPTSSWSYTHARAHTHSCIYICVCVYMCTYTYLLIYIYIYICIYII